MQASGTGSVNKEKSWYRGRVQPLESDVLGLSPISASWVLKRYSASPNPFLLLCTREKKAHCLMKLSRLYKKIYVKLPGMVSIRCLSDKPLF